MQLSRRASSFLPALVVVSTSSLASTIAAAFRVHPAASTAVPRSSSSLLKTKYSSLCYRGGGSCALSSSSRSSTLRSVASDVMTTTATLSSSSTPYGDLIKELDAVQQLSRAMNVLEYDKMVFMPSTDGASMERGKQLAALAAVIHDKATSPRIGELIHAAEDAVASECSSPDVIRNLELARREYTKKTCIPTELEAKRAALSSEAYTTWAKARQADDFGMFSSVLNQCIELAIELAKCQTSDASASLYGTMLDEYEIGMDPARIDAVFDEIKEALVPLIERVLGPDATPPSTAALQGQFPLDSQQQLCKKIVRAMGFDDSQGRIDVSVHPFSMSLNPSDVRITARFREDDWYQGLAAMMHEGGHAIYEQNLGSDILPVNSALSMGMHESQSLFWERHVGLSRPFWRYAAPIINESLGTSFTAEDFYGAVNAAARSFIRVEADELTYPLHVILRYQIERDFIDGQLSSDEIPSAGMLPLRSFLVSTCRRMPRDACRTYIGQCWPTATSPRT